MSRLKIKVTYDDSFTEKEKQKHMAATALLETLLNTEEFRNAVITSRFDTTRKTSEEVYAMLVSGATVLQPTVDRVIEVYPTLYYKKNSVVGYTYPSTVRTWINKKFFAVYSYAQVAQNLFHEYAHKVGLP